MIPDLSEELAEDSIGVDESGTWVTAGRSPSPEVCGTQAFGTLEGRGGEGAHHKSHKDSTNSVGLNG